jgi:hypothetical protein
MAFLELTKEEKPKLAVQVNNSLKYKDKDGNLQDRQKITALIDIAKEASSVAGMDKGAVSLSLNTDNGFKNYFVNRTKNDDIALVPMDKEQQQDKDNYIYFNKKLNVDDPSKYFYTMSKAGNAEATLDSIKVVTTDKSAYLGARVTLSNKEIMQDMLDIENKTGERQTAIIGKDKLEIVSNAELQTRRETNQSIDTQNRDIENKINEKESKNVKDIPVEIQDKSGNVVEQTTTKNTKTKENIEPKKPYKPKEKAINNKDLER